ncbi:MAG: metal-dependent hydrolase [Ilumatobacteraceae bacterium]
MSWAAHQFEYYALQGHLPRRWLGKVSFLGVVVGDQSCDLIGKLWSYGIDIGGAHYGPDQPSQWHRGWIGLGPTHSVLWAFIAAGAVYLISKNRSWTLGVGIGAAIHAMTDIGDTVGTMLAFPFSTQTYSIGAWAYAATAEGGKYLDAAAYYSSWGFVMDALWFVVALSGARCLTLRYWRANVVTADPRAWGWLGRRLPERVLVTLYRAWFFYAICRLIAWTAWAHVIEDFEWDLSWGGPGWIPKAVLSHPEPLAAITAVLVSAVVVCVAVGTLVRLPDRVLDDRRVQGRHRIRSGRRAPAEPPAPSR